MPRPTRQRPERPEGPEGTESPESPKGSSPAATPSGAGLSEARELARAMLNASRLLDDARKKSRTSLAPLVAGVSSARDGLASFFKRAGAPQRLSLTRDGLCIAFDASLKAVPVTQNHVEAVLLKRLRDPELARSIADEVWTSRVTKPRSITSAVRLTKARRTKG
jgi:hypothetical protein